MGDLAVDTAVEGNDGPYHARLSPAWEVWGPNGGYVASIALRAAAAATPLRRPASFACHFLSVAEFGAVDLAVTPLRTARRAVSLRVSMTQRTRPILEAFAWFIGEVEGLAHDAAVMPTLPGPDGLKSIDELVPPEEQAPFPFWQNLEVRPTRFVPPEGAHRRSARVAVVVSFPAPRHLRRPGARRGPHAPPHRHVAVARRLPRLRQPVLRRSEHRPRRAVPPPGASGRVAPWRRGLPGGNRRPRRRPGHGVVARRPPARLRREPAPVPAGAAALKRDA